MPRGPPLTDIEKGKILAHHSRCLSVRKIAKKLKRSRDAVQRFIDIHDVRERVKIRKPHAKLSTQNRRVICREAREGFLSANDIRTQYQLPVTVRRVQQLLNEDADLIYKKMKKSPNLTPVHIEACIKFAREWMHLTEKKWAKIVFSDEKKFNLDEPDGLACYLHDLRKDERIFGQRQQGDDSVMLWGEMSYYGLSDLVLLRGSINSVKYCKVLQRNLLPFAAETLGESWVFQQDNASIHRSNYTRRWLMETNVPLLQWPAKSPDLNIKENIWGTLARRVYKTSRQFHDIEELQDFILKEWNGIGDELVRTHYKYLQKRLMDV